MEDLRLEGIRVWGVFQFLEAVLSFIQKTSSTATHKAVALQLTSKLPAKHMISLVVYRWAS